MEYEIPLGNPVIECLIMNLNGCEFEVVVPDDGRRERVYTETDGE